MKRKPRALHRLAIPISIENDVKCMALAQWAARGKRKDDDFLLVASGSGIGAAIVKGGRLVRGAHNTARHLAALGLEVREVDASEFTKNGRGIRDLQLAVY